MGSFLETIPYAGITRIRDLMYTVERPFRLDQGDVSFDAPETFKAGMRGAIETNQTHYLATSGLPRLRQLLMEKLARRNGIPVNDPEDVLVANGGVHAMYLACQALLDPGDEVLLPDPEWPASRNNILAARAVPVTYPLHESRSWRFDIDEVAARVTPRTKVLYINSPNNPTGGVLTRDDIEAAAQLARERDLWVIADEAYEDILFDGAVHHTIAALPGMYERTIPICTFSKTYAVTGLRLGYFAVHNAALREQILKLLFLTTSNVSSVIQYGGIAALEGSQDVIDEYRRELRERRDVFYAGIADAAGHVFTGLPPQGAFYAFLRINPAWEPPAGSRTDSRSWAMVEHLIARGRVGCVPGVDFGPAGEDYVRFCFARDRAELRGALDSMREVFGHVSSAL
jgi:aspartate aminotransferase